MAKTLFDGRVETTITGEKGIGFKRNSNTFEVTATGIEPRTT